MSKHTIEQLDNPTTVEASVASSIGKGSDKDLRVVTELDGYGNHKVTFLVKDHGKETTFQRFNEAVFFYNLLA